MPPLAASSLALGPIKFGCLTFYRGLRISLSAFSDFGTLGLIRASLRYALCRSVSGMICPCGFGRHCDQLEVAVRTGGGRRGYPILKQGYDKPRP